MMFIIVSFKEIDDVMRCLRHLQNDRVGIHRCHFLRRDTQRDYPI